VVNPNSVESTMNNVSESAAVRGHLGRLRALANELEIEADLFEKELREAIHADTIPAPPPDDPRAALLGRVADEAERLCSAALNGKFSCVHCSSPGPHADQSTEDAVAFVCGRCNKPLAASDLKVAVFATLARIAAEART
jgi:hypothetical protein